MKVRIKLELIYYYILMKILIIFLLAVTYSYVLEDKIDHVPVMIFLFRDIPIPSMVPCTPAILIWEILIDLLFMFLLNLLREREIQIH